MRRASITIIIERVLPWVVLAILLAYTYARFFVEPYSGFDIDSDGDVVHVYLQGNPGAPLRIGDHLMRVGPMAWADFQSNYRATLFEGILPGQEVLLLVERAGTQISIPWKYPGQNPGQLASRAASGFWLGYLFWLTGMLIGAHLRPRGESRNLALAFSYLTALWLVVNNPAGYHVWGSAIVLRIVIWFEVPVYLGFHWLWPLPFGKPRAIFIWAGFFLAGMLALGEYFQALPERAYLVGFFTSIVGTLFLLAAHALLQPTTRSRLRWLLVVLFLAFVPLLGYPVLGSSVAPGVSASLASVGLPFIPLAYFSSLYRRQLGDLEVRINRVISVYGFLVLQGLVVLPLISLLAFRFPGPATVILVGATVGIFSAVVTVAFYPAFQSFVEQRLLGIPIPERGLVATYAAQVTQCNSLSDIASLLKKEVLPSLLVRQFAFLLCREHQAIPLLVVGFTDGQTPDGPALRQLMNVKRTNGSPDSPRSAMPYPAIRLLIPLRIGDELLGAWLLGRRDPDDLYSAADKGTIQSLADQTAVAVSNIRHEQNLRELYQANVNRNEEERLRLALKLHDSILNRLAVLLMKLDETAITPAFMATYEDLSNLVRGIVSDLRPPMLAYGLKPAIEELVEDRIEEVAGQVQISVDIRSDDIRYAPLIELHIFRIVQESLANALEHAHARSILIAGHLNPEEAEIRVRDDGVGFAAPDGAALPRLIAEKHFGMAGLIERATLINAHVQIESAPRKGTCVLVNWRAKPG